MTVVAFMHTANRRISENTAMATQTLTPPLVERAEYILPIVLRLSPVIELTKDQFLAFCEMNDTVRIERTAGGELEIMPPVDLYTGNKELDIAAQLRNWTRRGGRGIAFGPSAGFILPNGAVRSPDAARISKSRLAKLTTEDKRGFGHICPDFVIELRSQSDSLAALKAKMEEYMENGARLGWLIDPQNRRVYVYRPDSEIETLENPENVSAEPELKAFALDLNEIWAQPF